MAVDLLEGDPMVDPGRIGYLGVSYGGAMSGLLAGVEKRIAAFVLVVGDGGLVSHFSGPEDDWSSLDHMSPAAREAWLEAMNEIEPLHYVGLATSPLLFQSGRLDYLVPIDEAELFHAAGNELSTVIWYDSGHNMGGVAWCDGASWLANILQFDATKMPQCAA